MIDLLKKFSAKAISGARLLGVKRARNIFKKRIQYLSFRERLTSGSMGGAIITGVGLFSALNGLAEILFIATIFASLAIFSVIVLRPSGRRVPEEWAKGFFTAVTAAAMSLVLIGAKIAAPPQTDQSIAAAFVQSLDRVEDTTDRIDNTTSRIDVTTRETQTEVQRVTRAFDDERLAMELQFTPNKDASTKDTVVFDISWPRDTKPRNCKVEVPKSFPDWMGIRILNCKQIEVKLDDYALSELKKNSGLALLKDFSTALVPPIISYKNNRQDRELPTYFLTSVILSEISEMGRTAGGGPYAEYSIDLHTERSGRIRASIKSDATQETPNSCQWNGDFGQLFATPAANSSCDVYLELSENPDLSRQQGTTLRATVNETLGRKFAQKLLSKPIVYALFDSRSSMEPSRSSGLQFNSIKIDGIDFRGVNINLQAELTPDNNLSHYELEEFVLAHASEQNTVQTRQVQHSRGNSNGLYFPGAQIETDHFMQSPPGAIVICAITKANEVRTQTYEVWRYNDQSYDKIDTATYELPAVSAQLGDYYRQPVTCNSETHWPREVVNSLLNTHESSKAPDLATQYRLKVTRDCATAGNDPEKLYQCLSAPLEQNYINLNTNYDCLSLHREYLDRLLRIENSIALPPIEVTPSCATYDQVAQKLIAASENANTNNYQPYGDMAAACSSSRTEETTRFSNCAKLFNFSQLIENFQTSCERYGAERAQVANNELVTRIRNDLTRMWGKTPLGDRRYSGLAIAESLEQDAAMWFMEASQEIECTAAPEQPESNATNNRRRR